MKKKRLGEMLVEEKVITDEQLQEALNLQKKLGMKLGEVLEEQGLISEEKVINVLRKQIGIEFIDLDKIQIQEEILNMLGEEYAKKYHVIPIDLENGKMVLAMSDPLDYFAINDIKMLVGLKIKPVITYKNSLENAIKKYYGKSVAEKAIGEYVKQNNIKIDKEEINTENEKNAPIIKLINTIIENAVRNKASDIHIEPNENELRIRYRIDGVLREAMNINSEITNPIVSRIKIMCNLDTTERRKPQDGRAFQEIEGRKIDLRISILPVSYGEKVVIRILDKNNFVLNKTHLGLSENELEIYNDIITRPNGIVLVTGPTGSGKTTTLYTILSELNSLEKNIVTVEDPIEYNFKGINQVQVNNKVGLSFADGLRAILRQDPDIVMLGEIRDQETAEIAIRAALTGHLVLSTLHTNDSIGTITRLTDMGIEPFLISSTLLGVIAQRLVRKICPNCKVSYKASNSEKKILKVPLEKELTLHKGKGCTFCNNTGYKERLPLFEMLSIDNQYKEFIENEKGYTELNKLADNKNLQRLKDNGIIKVLNGLTTVEELLRITY